MNKLAKIIEYGLYILVFLLPWQTRWIIKAGELNGGYWEYGTYSLYATDVLLTMLVLFNVVLWFLSSRSKKLEVRSMNQESDNLDNKFITSHFSLLTSKIWYLIAGLELFVFISIFLAPDKLLALFGYGRFLLGVGLFWLIISASYNKLKLIYSFLAGVCLSAGLGIWQFLTQSSFASKWLGLALHDPANCGTSVVETLSGERWLRAYGNLDHPNVLGALLAIGILFTTILLIIRNNNDNENSKLKIQNSKLIILFTLYFIFYTAVFFTFSRSAWFSLAVGLLAMLFVVIFKKQKETLTRLMKNLIISAVMLVILVGLYPSLVKTRLSSDARLEVKSNVERLESYTIAKEVIKKHWLFGTGINNYTLAVYNEIDSEQPVWYYQPVHNTFLLVLAEIGIIGLIFFILLLCVMCYVLCKKQEKIGISIIIVLAFIAIFDHYLWSLHFGVLLFFLALGLAEKKIID